MGRNAHLIQWLKRRLQPHAGFQKWFDAAQLQSEYEAEGGPRYQPSSFRRTIRRMGYDCAQSSVNVSVGSLYRGGMPGRKREDE